ncbi:thiamine phosphate synthase [Pandoraea sputorum]|nr:thiamine phosphate synthase [Pandoraea sputorum]
MQTSIPVYALGGMSAETVSASLDAGASGIAAIRGLWKGVDERS